MGIFDRKSVLGRASAGEKSPSPKIDLDRAAAESSVKFGQPSLCNKCGGRGYLDRVDLVNRVMFQHCLSCNHKWELTEAELSKPA